MVTYHLAVGVDCLTLTTGLGNKKLSFLQYGDSDDTHFTILEAFPQLRDAGGYESKPKPHTGSSSSSS